MSMANSTAGNNAIGIQIGRRERAIQYSHGRGLGVPQYDRTHDRDKRSYLLFREQLQQRQRNAQCTHHAAVITRHYDDEPKAGQRPWLGNACGASFHEPGGPDNPGPDTTAV